jgi:hypothetical protein
MIITTTNNNKIFIQFDRLVKNGLISLNDNSGFEMERDITDTEFEVFELPENIKTVHLTIYMNNEKTFLKTINLK